MAEKRHKKGKIIIISVVSAILVLAGAAAGTYQFYIKPKYADKLIETADKVLQSEGVKELLESEEVQKILEEDGTKQLLDKINGIPENSEINKLLQSQGSTSDSASENKTSVNDENNASDGGNAVNGNNAGSGSGINNGDKASVIVGGTPQKNTPSQTDAVSKSNDENKQDSGDKDAISPKDMVDGMKIMSKIDMDKVSGLTSGNATAEEKSASIKYIRDTLTNEEIAKAIELMAKYKETLK